MVNLDIIVVGILSVNCYLVWHSETKEAYVVDPGADAALIEKRVAAVGLTPRAILMTHGHVDHLLAVPHLAKKWQVPVWIHAEDVSLYQSPDNALLPWIPAAENLPAPVPEIPVIDGLEFTLLHTPGHTRGGVCFYFPNEKFVLTGDTLFKGTHGRTDFPGGSQKQIMHSIHNILFKLPDETKVYPGHHGASTIGNEKKNPFF
ncbi:MAG: MBL fold metallo-hydrolase [Lentisphaerae bacterium]|jgi:hydroxyacylglutathione hydrolase|nr:MBL fold metallo-hydrolase [Lentisphaerota bacterium]